MSTFQQLAKLRVPVASGSVIWLDGQHLEGASATSNQPLMDRTAFPSLAAQLCPNSYLPSSTAPLLTAPAEDQASGSLSERVIRLKFVCWLHLSASIPGALPGRYEARCRMRFLPGWFTDEINLTANPQEGCGESATRRYTWQQLANSVGPGWVEISTGPVEVTQPCSVDVTLHAHTGNWKRNILFDTMRLVPVGRPRPEWASPSRRQQQVPSQQERGMRLRSGRSVGWEGCSVQ